MTNDFFPDGTEIADFFYEGSIPFLHEYGKRYVITDYGIKNDNEVHTKKIQELIDKIHLNGGGCIVIPKGIYKTGALHLKQGVNLFIEEGGTLLGSDDISDYPVCETRIEGETCLYFPALINADSVDRLKIGGKGTIDGNGILIAPIRMSKGRGYYIFLAALMLSYQALPCRIPTIGRIIFTSANT